jgi:hypothetical protein
MSKPKFKIRYLGSAEDDLAITKPQPNVFYFH